MIQWQLNISHYENNKIINLNSNELLQLNETDIIQVEVIIEKDILEEKGEPFVVIGDVPHKMQPIPSSDNNHIFKTINSSNKLEQQLFYNYFGESEIKLYFTNSNEIIKSKIIDIRARKANAKLAMTMLEYINNNADDMVSLCFSRSYIGGDLEKQSEADYHKIHILKLILSFIENNQHRFIRDHKFVWENKLIISQQGQPTGPDSVYWALQNLDKLLPSRQEDANIKISNRLYKIEEMPKENIIENSDVFENRVIFSFLNSAREFLHSIKYQCEKELEKEKVNEIDFSQNDDFISFDNSLRSYKKGIISHYLLEINLLVKKNEQLIHFFNKYIPTKLIPSLPPKLTTYTQSKIHYRDIFKLINKWYLASKPNLLDNILLMGLKNLSSIYEITCLLMLSKTIKNTFQATLERQEFHNFGEEYSFYGEEHSRPEDRVNNYFIYKNNELRIEMLYEPKIYPYRKKNTKKNDLVDISNTKKHDKFGIHFYQPDYIIRITSINWSKPLLIVLDAKYSNKSSVNKYSLPKLTQKYLHDIHMLNKNGRMGTSPIKLMMILYAHGETSRPASKLNSIHQLTGELPVLPQAVGLRYTPNATEQVGEWLKLVTNEFGKETNIL